jgi:hypothetical protein
MNKKSFDIYTCTHIHIQLRYLYLSANGALAPEKDFFFIHEVITWEKRKKSPANILLTHTVTIPVPIGQRCAGGDLARRQKF